MQFLKHVFLSAVALGLSQPVVFKPWGEKPLIGGVGMAILGFIAYVPIFIALAQAKNIRQAFWLGWFTSFLQYSLVLYWFLIAMIVFGHIHFTLALFSLLAASSLIAVYYGWAFAIAHYLCKRFLWPLWLCCALSITAADYLRNFFPFGGFPWGNIGYAVAYAPLLAQTASLFGVYGLVFFIVLINGCIAYTWIHRHPIQWLHLHTSFHALKPLGIALGCMALMLSYGAWRMGQWDERPLPKIRLGLLQGNIEQGIKNKSFMFREDILKKYALLQEKARAQGAELIIWPEAAYPGGIALSQTHFRHFMYPAPLNVIGAIGFSPNKEGIHNSAFVVDAQLKILGRFDKNHLVPFGEYVPWPLESLVHQIVPGFGSLVAATTQEPLVVTVASGLKVPLGATICYEGLFPQISRKFAKNGALLLINLTNDAWYGISSAPHQHLSAYVMRSIETGRTYARATNTGISALIDPRGQIVAQTKLYQDAALLWEAPLSEEITPYVHIGDVIPIAALLCSMLGFFLLLLDAGQGRKRKSYDKRNTR